MMATEATLTTAATSFPTPGDELTKPASANHNHVSNEPVVNGTASKDDIKVESESAEAAPVSAEVSVSGGSDTEASKADTSQGKGHARTGSTTVKKFASFKPVSVNKTFLAAKTTTATAPSKLGDKISTPPPPGPLSTFASRPRLVAKTGSSLRDSSPRNSGSANGGKNGGAPDAGAVWNKNRPAPPPEPKRFTDEELKQRYGIHLATRLESDAPGKQANWADIDDDDDDWAPDTIEWTDGTKITLTEDVAQPPAPEPTPAPAPVLETKLVDPPKSKSPTPSQQSAPSPITKPNGLASGKAGLVLKGVSEKPTLVAKPPGPPTPVRSPWATLPPVDKASPVNIETPRSQQQQHQQSQPFQQPRINQQTREADGPEFQIAADDFRRSWRDNSANSNSSKELYNSQSGRYEPVSENRRGSSRPDGQSKQPAVLQRPSQQEGPAEPSAAFQTHRSTAQDNSHGRRRTSSNVSGGSGFLTRRMSRGLDLPSPQESFNARRGSLAAVSDTASSPHPNSASSQVNHKPTSSQQWQRASPSATQSPQSVNSVPVPAATENQSQPPNTIPKEDDLVLQEKVMRQARELARKRRQEEEAREEAERKERIRLKLLAMGPPPEKKKKEVSTEEKLEKEIGMMGATRLNMKQDDASQKSVQTSPNDASQTQQQQQQKPRVPPSPAAAPEENVDSLISPTLHLNKPAERPVEKQEHHLNGVSHGETTAPIRQPSRDRTGAPEQSNTWQNSTMQSSDRYQQHWSSGAVQPPSSRNVWGPPSSDKTLGNGTFNPDLGRLPDVRQGPSNPGPIGPPSSSRQGGQLQNQSQTHNGRGGQYGSRPGPIGPPNRNIRTAVQPRAEVAASGWASFPSRVAEEDAMIREHNREEEAKIKEAQRAGLLPDSETIKEHFTAITIDEDGFRKTHTTEQQKSNSNQALGHTNDTNTPKKPSGLPLVSEGHQNHPTDSWISGPNGPNFASTKSQAPIYGEKQPGANHPVSGWIGSHGETMNRTVSQERDSSRRNVDTWRSTQINPSAATRGSRFFPKNQDIRLEESFNAAPRSLSPTPPPPTMDGHPAYDGDVTHPHVCLPMTPPVVKLPPAMPVPIVAIPKPASFAAAVSASAVPPVPAYPRRQSNTARPVHGAQDIRRQEVKSGDWQDKFDSLVGRKATSPPRAVFDVDSSSKNALELPKSRPAATVSLPMRLVELAASSVQSVVSKPVTDECFEEQEMGSIPVIKLPNIYPPDAWNIAPSPKALSRKLNSSDTMSVEPLHPGRENFVTIKIPGQVTPRKVSLPNQRQRSNPRGGNGTRGIRNPSSSHSGRGNRQHSGSGFTPTKGDNVSTASPPVSSGHSSRGNRGHKSTWSRQS